jgi:hypothetical protein
VTPHHILLPAGSLLWRVHAAARDAGEFNTMIATSPFGGSRFDGSIDDPYSFLYIASSERAAVCEALLRDVEFNANGERLVPKGAVAGKMLTILETTCELRMISLETAHDLAVISQDSWVVEAPPLQYAHTRYWARWLRTMSTAQGIVWQSRLHRPDRAFMLFGDRCGVDVLKPVRSGSVKLWTAGGRGYLNGLMGAYRVLFE